MFLCLKNKDEWNLIHLDFADMRRPFEAEPFLRWGSRHWFSFTSPVLNEVNKQIVNVPNNFLEILKYPPWRTFTRSSCDGDTDDTVVEQKQSSAFCSRHLRPGTQRERKKILSLSLSETPKFVHITCEKDNLVFDFVWETCVHEHNFFFTILNIFFVRRQLFETHRC